MNEVDRFKYESLKNVGQHLFAFTKDDDSAPIYIASNIFKDKDGYIDAAFARYIENGGQLEMVYEYRTIHALNAVVDLLLREGYSFAQVE